MDMKFIVNGKEIKLDSIKELEDLVLKYKKEEEEKSQATKIKENNELQKRFSDLMADCSKYTEKYNEMIQFTTDWGAKMTIDNRFLETRKVKLW